MRGIWRCKGGCNRWNIYVSRLKNILDPTIDTRCSNCGQRKKFKALRLGDRGRPRNIEFWKRPEHMPRHALLAEARMRNQLRQYQTTGFIPASEIEGGGSE